MNEVERFDSALERLEQLRSEYEEITQTQIPATLQQAVSQKWELLPNGIEIALLAHYPTKEQEADGTRLMSLGRALQIITSFENGLVQHHTRGAGLLAWRQLTSTPRRIVFWSANVHRFAELVVTYVADAFDIFDITSFWDLIFELPLVLAATAEALVLVWRVFTTETIEGLIAAAETTALKAPILHTFETRDQHADILRLAAFPQAVGVRRYRRRKKSRRN